MKRFLLAGVAAAVLAGSTMVYAQGGPWMRERMQHMRLSPEDRAAFVDARIAAVHAGLKLTPDQEKLWPPVEAAVRDFAKLRIDRANARMNAQRNEDEQQRAEDPIARLRERADNMAAASAALRKIADAADPLYKSLDDGQKRRLAMLTHGRFGEGGNWRHRWMERGMGRGMGMGMDRDNGNRGYRDDRDDEQDQDGSGRL